MTIHALQKTLEQVEANDGFLPPTLFLQLDNCFRENKNSYLLAYLAWLVERRVFDAIYLSFLPVGHTHNECDQCASCFGLACRHNDITSLSDLISLFRQSFYPEPVVEYISEVADVKRMMNPDLSHHFGTTSHIKQCTNVSTPCFDACPLVGLADMGL